MAGPCYINYIKTVGWGESGFNVSMVLLVLPVFLYSPVLALTHVNRAFSGVGSCIIYICVCVGGGGESGFKCWGV